jgi:hypothetical protein
LLTTCQCLPDRVVETEVGGGGQVCGTVDGGKGGGVEVAIMSTVLTLAIATCWSTTADRSPTSA